MLRSEKKRTVLLAVVFAALMLSACGGSGGKGESAAAEASQTQGAASDTETDKASTDTEALDDTEDAASEADYGTEGSDKAASGAMEGQDEGLALHVALKSHVFSEYDEEDMGLLYSLSYEEPYIRDEGYEELKASLEKRASERFKRIEIEREQLMSAAKAGKELSSSDGFFGYTSEGSINVLRADSRVLSFMTEAYSYTGGAHGNGGVTAEVYDTKSGKRLGVSDVIADKAGLESYITAKLEEDYGSQDMLFEGWEQWVHDEIAELPYEAEPIEAMEGDDYMGVSASNEPHDTSAEPLAMGLDFALTPEGMRVYFSPYEIGPWALGTITVDIPYTEEGLGFNEAYLPLAEQTVWPLEAYEELELDVDEDGLKEQIGLSFQAQEDQSQSTYTLFVTDGEDTASLNGVCGYGMDKAYIMKEPEGGYVFYGECKSNNDWRYLSMADITEMWEERSEVAAAEPSEYYESFYDNVPVSAESFYLSTRGSLLSTVSISREHRVGTDGFPEAVQEDFLYDDFELTAKQDIKGTEVSSGEAAEISAGAKLRAVSTDEASYAVLEDMESGARIRVGIDGSDWPHTIDGTDIEELFDGLIFAG